jgi:hypothetical protein
MTVRKSSPTKNMNCRWFLKTVSLRTFPVTVGTFPLISCTAGALRVRTYNVPLFDFRHDLKIGCTGFWNCLEIMTIRVRCHRPVMICRFPLIYGAWNCIPYVSAMNIYFRRSAVCIVFWSAVSVCCPVFGRSAVADIIGALFPAV